LAPTVGIAATGFGIRAGSFNFFIDKISKFFIDKISKFFIDKIIKFFGYQQQQQSDRISPDQSSSMTTRSHRVQLTRPHCRQKFLHGDLVPSWCTSTSA
jgi:hypothetical protein